MQKRRTCETVESAEGQCARSVWKKRAAVHYFLPFTGKTVIISNSVIFCSWAFSLQTQQNPKGQKRGRTTHSMVWKGTADRRGTGRNNERVIKRGGKRMKEVKFYLLFHLLRDSVSNRIPLSTWETRRSWMFMERLVLFHSCRRLSQ